MDLLGPCLFFSSIVFHAALLVLGKRFIIQSFQLNLSPVDAWSAANWSVSILQAVLATLVGSLAVLETKLDIIDSPVEFLKPYAWFNLGYWMYDLICLFIIVIRMADGSGRSFTEDVLKFVKWWPGIVFHHIGIIVFLTLGILYTSRTRGDGIVGFALLMELSSIFVALRSFLGKLKMKGTRVYLMVSIAMVATFFVCRVFLVPYVILLYCRQADLGLWEGILSLPTKCKVGTFSFYVLNIYWFSLMLKGCVKAIRNGGIKED